MQDSAYAILGVASSATDAEIKKVAVGARAWRDEHPDPPVFCAVKTRIRLILHGLSHSSVLVLAVFGLDFFSTSSDLPEKGRRGIHVVEPLFTGVAT